MSNIPGRIAQLEASVYERAEASAQAFGAWLAANGSEEEKRAYWRWIAAPFASGEMDPADGFDFAAWGGPEAVAKWIADNSGYREEVDAPILEALGARMPADLKRRTFEAWLFWGASEDCLDWLE